MRILFLTDDFPPRSFGGAGIVAYNLARALKQKGNEIAVITTVRNKEEEGRTEYEGLTLYRIYSNYHERWRSYRSLYNTQTVGKVKKILSEFRPEVVHAHNIHFYLSYHTLKLAKNTGAKVFLTAHDVMSFHYGKLVDFFKTPLPTGVFDYRVSFWQQLKAYRLRYNPFRNIIIRYYLKYTDRIFAVSRALKSALEQNGIKNIEVIHNGIDVSNWSVSGEDVEKFKKKHHLGGKKTILFGGRLSEAKGGHQAIRVLKEVVAEVPNAQLLFIGDINQYMQHALKLAEELGVRERIIFTGWLEGSELKSAYGAADIVLVPSVYLDPFPTVNLEAMALGKPVVGTCYGGTSEVVEDGVVGFVTDPNSVGETSARVTELLQNEQLQKKFSFEAKKRILQNFSIEKQVLQVLNFYRQ